MREETTVIAIPETQEAPAVEKIPEAEALSITEALKEIAAFWPFVLRFGLFTGFSTLQAHMITEKDVELLDAYTAYQSLNGISIELLYSSIFAVVTLMSGAREKELEAEKEGNAEEAAAARKNAQMIWRQGFIFSLMLSAPAVVFGLTASPIFKLFSNSETLISNSRAFMMYSTPGFVGDIFYRLTARTVSGLGVQKSILIADGFDHLLELGFGYALLNGKFGFPELGIPGLAVAYSISKWITFSLHLLYMFTSPAFLKFDFKKYHLFSLEGKFYDKEIFKKLFSAGIADGISAILGGISSMLVVMFSGHANNETLSAIQAAGLYSNFSNFHMSAVLNTACARIGGYYAILEDEKLPASKKDIALKNIKTCLKLLLAGCITISIISCTLAFLIPSQLTPILIGENEKGSSHFLRAVSFLKIQGLFELLHGLTNPLTSVLSALMDNRFLLLTTVFFDLLASPGAAALTHYVFKKEAEWIFAASGISAVLTAIACTMRVYQKLHFSSSEEFMAAVNEQKASEERSAEKMKRCRERISHMIWGEKASNAHADMPVTNPNLPLLSA